MTWQLGTMLVLFTALAAGFGWYERSRPPARVLALVAALAALAAIGRVAFAAFPNVKPTTDIVLFSGMALGGPAGFAVGAVAALVSNVFLGQGPWTPWQMAAWGMVGLGGAALGRLLRGRDPGRLLLALACAVAGFAFGAVMDAYQWTLTAEHDLASYVAVAGTSLAFNVAHAVGNVGFALLMGPAFVRALRRYRRRFEVTWREPARAGAVAAALAAAVVVATPPAPATAAPPPDVAPAIARAVRWLEQVQNADGGYGGARGESSDPFFAQWAGLGLAAAGRNPLDVRKRGNSIAAYLRRNLRSVQATQDYERLVLVLRAGGISARSFGGRDLVTRLRRRQRADGSFDRLTDRTAVGILALRAAGIGTRASPVRRAAAWLAARRNAGGGWGNAPGSRSDVDNTAAVVQAFGAAGRRRTAAARAGVRFLRRHQRADGGFPLQPGGASNAQSTAYAVLAFEAAGVDPRGVRRSGRTPLGFLKAMQAGDGSIRYSRASAQTPVWVTAQAVLALEGRPLPLPVAPRRKAEVAARAAVGADEGGEGRGDAPRGAGADDGAPAGSTGEGGGAAAGTAAGGGTSVPEGTAPAPAGGGEAGDESAPPAGAVALGADPVDAGAAVDEGPSVLLPLLALFGVAFAAAGAWALRRP